MKFEDFDGGREMHWKEMLDWLYNITSKTVHIPIDMSLKFIERIHGDLN